MALQHSDAMEPWLARAQECATPAELFALLDQAGHAVLGHCLFSVNAAELNPLRVRRLYSSNPAAYPVGGFKDKQGTEWGQTVLLDQQTLICQGRAELERYFADAALILSLGVQSIINVPVVLGGRCVGVLNFSCPSPHISAQQAQAAQRMAGVAGPFFGQLAARPLLLI
jgi:GAF domain-containing protein